LREKASYINGPQAFVLRTDYYFKADKYLRKSDFFSLDWTKPLIYAMIIEFEDYIPFWLNPNIKMMEIK